MTKDRHPIAPLNTSDHETPWPQAWDDPAQREAFRLLFDYDDDPPVGDAPDDES